MNTFVNTVNTSIVHPSYYDTAISNDLMLPLAIIVAVAAMISVANAITFFMIKSKTTGSHPFSFALVFMLSTFYILFSRKNKELKHS